MERESPSVIVREQGNDQRNVPSKGERGPDEILAALRAGLDDNPRFAGMPEEEVARQIVLGGQLVNEPSPALVAEDLQAIEAEEAKPT